MCTASFESIAISVVLPSPVPISSTETFDHEDAVPQDEEHIVYFSASFVESV